MCELLIRVKDRGSEADPKLDAMLSKRGHVIAVCPDGWGWTQKERDNPEWVIVRVPGVDPEYYAAMLAGVKRDPVLPGDGPVAKARRAFSFDLDAVDELKDIDGRSANVARTLDTAKLDAAKRLTPVAPDIEVIG